MSERVKNHRKWQPMLKQWFEDNFGYEFCEMCGTTEKPIDIAHRKKRYDIHDKTEYFMAVMLCRKHHQYVEHGKHDRMFELVTEIIENR